MSSISRISMCDAKPIDGDSRVALYLPFDEECGPHLKELGVQNIIVRKDPEFFPFAESRLPLGWKAYANTASPLTEREVVLINAEGLPKALVWMGLAPGYRMGYVHLLEETQAIMMQKKAQALLASTPSPMSTQDLEDNEELREEETAFHDAIWTPIISEVSQGLCLKPLSEESLH